MKKAFWIGLLVVVAIIAVIVIWKVTGNSSTGTSIQGTGTVDSKLQAAKPEPLSTTGFGGYSLPTVDLGDGPVPLVRIPLDTWGGYAALFAANGGIKPNKESVFYKKHRFAVEFVSEENAQKQLDGFASGRYTMIWASMDTVPLLYDALKTDKRVIPQVIALFDWSVGGDGILVRDYIRKPQDLKGKTILTSSPQAYSFFLLWYLAQLDINPLDVKVVHIPDGDEALKTFKANKGIAAWVTWTPYLTDAVDMGSKGYVPETRMLITSKDANQLIADVLVARSDIIREKPEIIAGIVDSMFEGYELIAQGDTRAFAAMAEFYQLQGGASEAKSMLDEVHLASYPETLMFLDSENSIGAQKIFLLSQEYYRLLGVLSSSSAVEPERLLYAAGIKTAGAGGKYNGQKNTIQNSFNRDAALNIMDLENQRVVLATDIKLVFEAQRLDFDLDGTREDIVQNMKLLARVAEQMRILGTTMVKLIGHLDTSKVEEFRSQGQQAFIEASAQAKLISKRRAEFVKSVLVSRFKIDPERIITEGRGWDEPVDVNDPQANRRVEVKFISFE